MRILVDPGSHAHLNHGDDAMLAVALARLRDRLPRARFDVVTADPARLAEEAPGARPVPSAGRARLAAGGSRRARLRDPDVRRLLGAVLGARLVVVTGRGGLNDVFPDDARSILSLTALATRLRRPVALLGQGIGPLTDTALRARAAAVLPAAGVIGLREALAGPGILRELGVPDASVAVTGDDALSLARDGAGRADGPPDALGVSLRVAPYAGVDHATAARAVTAVRALGHPLLPVPVARYPGADDARDLAALGIEAAPVTGAAGLAARVARCRVVVSGSYHGAVFALARGIPAVGLAATPYYEHKLHGLSAAYGGAMPVLAPDDPGLGAAVERAWAAAADAGPALHAATAAQIAAGEAAYDRAAALAERGRTG